MKTHVKKAKVQKLFGADYINGIRGWAFSEKEIAEAEEKDQMLMIDFEWGTRCSLNCVYCFRREDVRDRGLPSITVQQAFDIIDQAKELGCKSIHFVGQGESIEDKDFFRVAAHVHEKGMIPLLFTAGHVIGDDRLAWQFHGISGVEIAKKLNKIDMSIILKVNHPDPGVQDRIVGYPRYFLDDKGKIVINYKRGEPYPFTYFNNIGLKRLIKEGFNKPIPTRLGADILILGGKYTNYDKVFDLYVHFRKMNICPFVVTFIPCGRTAFREQREKFDVSGKEKIELWKRIYKWNMDNGIKYEGISAFAGAHVCRQRRFGLYCNVRGEVYRCPGEFYEYKLGSLVGDTTEKKTLRELWSKARNLKNDKSICPPRIQSHSLPRRLAKEVDEYIRSL